MLEVGARRPVEREPDSQMFEETGVQAIVILKSMSRGVLPMNPLVCAPRLRTCH